MTTFDFNAQGKAYFSNAALEALTAGTEFFEGQGLHVVHVYAKEAEGGKSE